jgi:hypothetical protein
MRFVGGHPGAALGRFFASLGGRGGHLGAGGAGAATKWGGRVGEVARTMPIGPGGLQSADMYEGTFAKKNRARGLPAPGPPGAPPVLGSLVWRAEGLPSTRNWPFRWPLSLSPTSPPQVAPKAM